MQATPAPLQQRDLSREDGVGLKVKEKRRSNRDSTRSKNSFIYEPLDKENEIELRCFAMMRVFG